MNTLSRSSNLTHTISVALLIVASMFVFACSAEVKVDVPNDSTSTDSDTATIVDGDAGATSNGSGTGDTTGTAVTGGKPPTGGNNGGNNNGGTTDPSATGNIRVSSPQSGDLITGRRFTLRGECRTFESTGNYRLRGEDGRELASGHFTATGEMGKFSPYTTIVELTRVYTGDAVLEVFESSAKDGSEINMVRVPLRIGGGETSAAVPVAVFFTNSDKNPGASDCSRVFPTTRRPGSTTAIARAALEELLKGPTGTERGQKFDTEIPEGTRLRDITIERGTAIADFSRELNTAAGSCSVTAARAQIERTLKQFPTVTRVVIAVEGSANGVLQP